MGRFLVTQFYWLVDRCHPGYGYKDLIKVAAHRKPVKAVVDARRDHFEFVSVCQIGLLAPLFHIVTLNTLIFKLL